MFDPFCSEIRDSYIRMTFRYSPETERKTGGAIGEIRSGKSVGETVGKILQAIRENPKITREGLSEITGLSIRGVEWNIAKLKKRAY